MASCARSTQPPVAATEQTAETADTSAIDTASNDSSTPDTAVNASDTAADPTVSAPSSDTNSEISSADAEISAGETAAPNPSDEQLAAEQAAENDNSQVNTENAGISDASGNTTSGMTAPEMTPIQKLIAEQHYAEARNLALKALREGETSDSSEFWAAVESDPLLTQTLFSEVKPHGTNSISALGGGSTVSFKYKDSADENAKAALKPDQDLRQTMYRSGIAYYRLCQILGCSFDTPVSRPAKFSKADFNTLYNASDSSKNKGYRAKFEHLIWEKENGTTYLYTSYKEWISPFASFPIEATGVWSPLLKNPNAKLPEVRTFLKNILSGGRPGAVSDLGKLTEYAGNLTTRDLLQQISDIILLDYLTNNWDRFAGDQSNFGANCHFQPGGIIAIDNDAAFPAWHAPRVVRRLNMVEMFSRDLVNNLRVLDENVLFDHLFPNATKEEKKSFQRFSERRRDALKYIDGLIQKKGEDRVLVF